MSYLTYEEYQIMGGTLDNATFNFLLLDVESKLNHLTFGRIKELEEIPQAVKNLCYKLIGFYNETVIKSANNLSSYSNGIESFSFANAGDSVGSTSNDSQIYAIIQEYLWEYPELLYRGRKQWTQKR